MEQGIAQLVGQPWLKFRQLFKHAFRGRCAITIQNVSERLEIWKITPFYTTKYKERADISFISWKK